MQSHIFLGVVHAQTSSTIALFCSDDITRQFHTMQQLIKMKCEVEDNS